MWQGEIPDLFVLSCTNRNELTQADLIVSTLGNDPQVIAAARGLAGAEQNFNPFVVDIPSICSDPTLPTTAALRGVVPLIDPAVTGSTLENANAATSLTTPFDATGLSVADVMVAQGFSNFTTKSVAGVAGTPGASVSTSSNNTVAAVASISVSSSSVAEFASTSIAAASSSTAVSCIASTTLVTVTRSSPSTSIAQAAAVSETASTTAAAAAAAATAASTSSSGASGTAAVTNAVTGNFDGFVASSIAGLDFGLCVPTMKFEAGLDGRATTENTFQAIDPLPSGQQGTAGGSEPKHHHQPYLRSVD